jgi:hypothetical protein
MIQYSKDKKKEEGEGACLFTCTKKKKGLLIKMVGGILLLLL